MHYFYPFTCVASANLLIIIEIYLPVITTYIAHDSHTILLLKADVVSNIIEYFVLF